MINNYGGTISALNGAINFRDAGYLDNRDTVVYGGDLYSKDVNVYTGGGTSDVYVNELTGVLNTSGTAAHVSANTETLNIGEQCLTGDPTYFNTGNITISGNINVGEDHQQLSQGEVFFRSAPNLTIRAVDADGNGCNIIIVAGANVTGTGSQTPNPLPTQPPISGNATTASFSGASAQGVRSSLNSGGLIDVSGSAPGTKAGNVTIAGYNDGVFPDSGEINMLGWDIKANGNGTAPADTNGNISIISGSTSIGSILVRNLRTRAAVARAQFLLCVLFQHST